MLKIKLFASHQNPATDRAKFHIKETVALDLLRSKRAVVCGDRAIQQVKVDREVVNSQDCIQCGQGGSYELAGIEKHLQIVQGGLVRNHPNKPIPFATGARVGHQ